MRIAMALASLIVLGGCMTVDWPTTKAQIETLDLLAETDRAIDDAYRDQPFDSGPVYVIANEHGDMHTYTLTLCRAGTHVCGGTGRVGHVERTANYYIVTGAYPGRTFHLSPGGDGFLTWRGIDRDLAWN